MVRKLVRPSIGSTAPSRQDIGSRRKPPEASGAEASYLAQARDDGSLLVISLVGGQELTGTLEFYDRRVLKLTLKDGTRIMLRREQIRYYHAERT